jgi:hypothetical protein
MIGIDSRLATSLAYRDECSLLGSVVKPIRLLTITCSVPPTEKPGRPARLSVSAAIPWPANAASP